jgi:predicted ATPase
MHIKNIHLTSFRRFSDLTISDLPASAKLVVMVGLNGSGKSSVFDAFCLWQRLRGLSPLQPDSQYHFKIGAAALGFDRLVSLDFHETPSNAGDGRSLFYIRSAYRHEADFTSGGLSRQAGILDASRVSRTIDADVTVSSNYTRLVSETVQAVYDHSQDKRTVEALRDEFIGQVRDSMSRVFDHLILRSIGDPLGGGTFCFEKGAAKDFPYKNLSGGEKAAFDLLLDVVLKRRAYQSAVFCIDEPEIHMHTRLQAKLLAELVNLLPNDGQLWIATHSIGMMRKAAELYSADPSSVVFLDFHERDFDQTVELKPVAVDRAFWGRTLEIALDDLAQLVAPRVVVLCEGRPVGGKDSRVEFDARCYRRIFSGEFPDTDFASVGNSHDTISDRLVVGSTLKTLIGGTGVVRLVDRDDRNNEEAADLRKTGARVLSRRHIEAYLWDEEILGKLCSSVGKDDKLAAVLAAKADALRASQGRGNAADDMKSAAGEAFNAVKVRIPTIVNAPFGPS